MLQPCWCSGKEQTGFKSAVLQGRKSFEGHGENQYNARAKKALKFTMQLLDMMLSDRNLHFFLPDTMRDPDTIALMLTSEATRAQMEAFLARKVDPHCPLLCWCGWL